MKTTSGLAVVSCAMLLVVSACSFAAGLPALPTSEFADTEVSTNVVFAVGEGGGRRLVFSLELEAATTNNVEVAIGCDAARPWRCKRGHRHKYDRIGIWRYHAVDFQQLEKRSDQNSTYSKSTESRILL